MKLFYAIKTWLAQVPKRSGNTRRMALFFILCGLISSSPAIAVQFHYYCMPLIPTTLTDLTHPQSPFIDPREVPPDLLVPKVGSTFRHLTLPRAWTLQPGRADWGDEEKPELEQLWAEEVGVRAFAFPHGTNRALNFIQHLTIMGKPARQYWANIVIPLNLEANPGVPAPTRVTYRASFWTNGKKGLLLVMNQSVTTTATQSLGGFRMLGCRSSDRDYERDYSEFLEMARETLLKNYNLNAQQTRGYVNGHDTDALTTTNDPLTATLTHQVTLISLALTSVRNGLISPDISNASALTWQEARQSITLAGAIWFATSMLKRLVSSRGGRVMSFEGLGLGDEALVVPMSDGPIRTRQQLLDLQKLSPAELVERLREDPRLTAQLLDFAMTSARELEIKSCRRNPSQCIY